MIGKTVSHLKNIEKIFESVYDLMHETDPAKYPSFY